MKIEIAEACSAWGWVCWLDGHPGLASWAQAVGVVATLIGAVVTVQIPLWAERKRRRVDRAARLQTAIDAAAIIGGWLDSEIGSLEEYVAGKKSAREVQEIKKSLAVAREHFLELTEAIKLDPQISFAIAKMKINIFGVEAALESVKNWNKASAKIVSDLMRGYSLESDDLTNYMVMAMDGHSGKYMDFLEKRRAERAERSEEEQEE